MILIAHITIAAKTEVIVTNRKMNPPTLLPEKFPVCNFASSSFVLGSNLTNSNPLQWYIKGKFC